jgi:hypothetical protein
VDIAVIRFLTCDFRLLEIDEEVASASLSDVFEQFVGYPPDFGPTGDAVTGHYFPTEDASEGQVVVIRRANKHALRRAVTLIQVRHRLSGVRIVTRPTVTAALALDDDWAPNLVEVPYDLDGVSIWPSASHLHSRDVVILELRATPGRFISTKLDSTTEIAEAMTFTDIGSARSYARAIGDETAIRLIWRAAALAELDQRRVGNS